MSVSACSVNVFTLYLASVVCVCVCVCVCVWHVYVRNTSAL